MDFKVLNGPVFLFILKVQLWIFKKICVWHDGWMVEFLVFKVEL